MTLEEFKNKFLISTAYKMTFANNQEGFMFTLPPLNNVDSTDTYIVMLDDKLEIKKVRNLLIYLEINRPYNIRHINEEEKEYLYNIIANKRENADFLNTKLKKMN